MFGFALVRAQIPVPTGWDLTFSDEFDGNPPNSEAQAFVKTAQNVRHNGSGQLELTAYKQSSGSKSYTSGKVNTSGKFMQTYGRWEARIKLPAAQIRFHVDGTLHGTVRDTDLLNFGRWVYNHDFRAILNLAVDFVPIYRPGSGNIIVGLDRNRFRAAGILVLAR